MRKGHGGSPIILVVEDVEETRDGIEKLLKADGYRVDPARNEQDAVVRALRAPPDLILLSLSALPAELVAAAHRIRKRGALNGDVPIVIFCVESIDEGAEINVGAHVYLTRPDNFNQLRDLLRRIFHASLPA
jgi:two-component system, OmpR family, response regulator MprA